MVIPPMDMADCPSIGWIMIICRKALNILLYREPRVSCRFSLTPTQWQKVVALLRSFAGCSEASNVAQQADRRMCRKQTDNLSEDSLLKDAAKLPVAMFGTGHSYRWEWAPIEGPPHILTTLKQRQLFGYHFATRFVVTRNLRLCKLLRTSQPDPNMRSRHCLPT